ncbi:MAG: DUF6785 family protein [Planctomycetota bacterium]
MPETQPVKSAPPAFIERASALTKKSLAIGLPLLLLWIFIISFALPNDNLLQQQLLLVSGFGAILSLFLLKFLVDFLPSRHRLNAAEMTFIYAMLIAGLPATVMGRLAIESAVANHCLEDLSSGERGFIPDFWAPNPHIGLTPRLDPPDARCPYLELPSHKDGAPRRTPMDSPPVTDSLRKIQAAVADSDLSLIATRETARSFDVSRQVVDTVREVEQAAKTARAALAAVSDDQEKIEPRRAAYLAWAAQLAADACRRGPECVQNADVVNSFRKGKVAVPWTAWAMPLLYWFLVMFAFMLAIVFGLMALRESWIERERLLFPYARLAEGVIYPDPMARNDPARQESFPKWGLGLAFLCGLLFCARSLVTISDTTGALAPPSNLLLYLDLSWLDLIPGVPMQLIIIPFALVFLLFFPLDLLFTVTLAFLVGEFGVPMFLNIIGVTDRVEVRYHVLRMGGMLGIAVFTAIFHRAELKTLVIGLWTRARGDERQPISARELSIGFVLTLTAFCFLIIVGEGETGNSRLTQILILVYMLVMIFIYNFAFIRARASGAFHYFDFNNILHTGGWFNWHWWRLTHTVPMAQGSKLAEPDSILNYHTQYQMETFGPYSQAMGPAAQVLDAFSLAESTRARLRDIFKGIVLGVTLALLIGMPLYLIAIHHVGYDNTPMAGAWNSLTLTTNKAERYYQKLVPGMFTNTSIWWVVGGALLVGGCMYLRREYSRFPIEPIGLFIAGANGGRTILGTDYIWFTIIIAFVAKWIIFRWYGVRAFQEKILPLGVYCLMAMIFGMTLYLFLSALILGSGMAF